MYKKINDMSKDEFNPTEKDLLTIDSLILEIKRKKTGLINKKMVLQNSLSFEKDERKKHDIKSDKYREHSIQVNGLKHELNTIELEIKALNEELIFKNKLRNEIVFHIKNCKKLEGKEAIEKITLKVEQLQKKYRQFAKDRTRISSLRIIANEFVDELDGILK